MISTEYGVYSTGGNVNASSARTETWFLGKNTYEWKPEAPMTVARSQHACGSFTFDNSTVLVVAGGYTSNSTEFLNLEEGTNKIWQLGPPPPFDSLLGHKIVSNEESLYYLNTFTNEFYQLMCPELLSNCYWEQLTNAKLRYSRLRAVAFMLPNDMLSMVDCKNPT